MVKNDIADEKVGYPAWQNLIALGGAVVVPLRFTLYCDGQG